MVINIFVIARIFVGCLFIVSGFEKLIGPHQNFLYIVQSYELFGAFLENIIAHVMPWIEFLLGVFLAVGLWLKWVLRAISILVLMFIFIVAQALVRNLSITECGCFGDIVSFPLHVILILECAFLFLIGIMIRKEEQTSWLSLDRYFDQPGG